MQASSPKAADKPARYVLTLAVTSAQGQVAAMVALLEKHGAYIEEFAVFDDALVSRFYVRIVFRLDGEKGSGIAALREAYAQLMDTFVSAEGAIHDLSRPTRVMIMVSKADHCLRDLLAQWRRKELNMLSLIHI